MPDAFPAATLPIYPSLEQAPSMLACIFSGLDLEKFEITEMLITTDTHCSKDLHYNILHTRILLESVSRGFSVSGSGPMLLVMNLTSLKIATSLSSASLRTFQLLSASSDMSSSLIRSLSHTQIRNHSGLNMNV